MSWIIWLLLKLFVLINVKYTVNSTFSLKQIIVSKLLFKGKQTGKTQEKRQLSTPSLCNNAMIEAGLAAEKKNMLTKSDN